MCLRYRQNLYLSLQLFMENQGWRSYLHISADWSGKHLILWIEFEHLWRMYIHRLNKDSNRKHKNKCGKSPLSVMECLISIAFKYQIYEWTSNIAKKKKHILVSLRILKHSHYFLRSLLTREIYKLQSMN